MTRPYNHYSLDDKIKHLEIQLARSTKYLERCTEYRGSIANKLQSLYQKRDARDIPATPL